MFAKQPNLAMVKFLAASTLCHGNTDGGKWSVKIFASVPTARRKEIQTPSVDGMDVRSVEVLTNKRQIFGGGYS